MSIIDKIDNITRIPEAYRHEYIPAPKSVKIELTGLCNFKCLHGDTPVDTIYGSIPIRELAEKYESVPVYTYKDGEVFISDAINIRKTGTNQKLVRVNFDDGTHIDCTPDHKFLQFRSMGKYGTEEFATEAKDLKPKDRLRAYRENVTGGGYINICVGRFFARKQHRLVMDYMMNRKLERHEIVHHIDKNVSNNLPENLQYFPSMKDHFAEHPEISERMKNDNPAFNMTDEWREKLTNSVKGKKRTLEQRMNYRESKLGEKNPNYIDGHTAGTKSRIEEVNHKVVSVELLKETSDVYCMEVPASGWFFANKVLVKNCHFCARSQKLRDQKEMDRDLFERLLLEMRDEGVEEIGLFYLGESFMCKWLEEAIHFAKHTAGFPYVFLTTNGSLATAERVDKCMSNGLDSLKWSLNYADESQFTEIAQVKKKLFHTMLQNIRDAYDIRQIHNYDCGLYASYIQYDGEQGERMKAMVKEMEPYVDEIYALPLYNQASFVTEMEEEKGWTPTAGNRGRLDALRDPLPCWAVLTEGHITWDGKLSACCFDHDNRFEMGDLTQQPFMKSWNSVKFQQLRKAHLAKDVSGTVCEHCVAWT